MGLLRKPNPNPYPDPDPDPNPNPNPNPNQVGLLGVRGPHLASRTGASLLSALGVPALATHSLRAYSDALAALLARGAPAPRPALLPAPLRARRSRTARRARPSRIEVSLAMA